MTLWDKFPKFVIGFIIVCSLNTALPAHLEEEVASAAYKMILTMYLCGQMLDFATTLATSYVMFELV